MPILDKSLIKKLNAIYESEGTPVIYDGIKKYRRVQDGKNAIWVEEAGASEPLAMYESSTINYGNLAANEEEETDGDPETDNRRESGTEQP